MKAQSPKKKEKERNNNNNKEKKKRISVWPEDMQQEKGSWLGQRICSKKNQHQGPRILMCPFETLRRGPWLIYGKTKVYVQISSKKPLKKSSKIKYYLCNPWSKLVGSRVDSKGEVVWSVGEWFLVKGRSWRFLLIHIFAWNAWANGKLSSPMCMTPPYNFLSIVIFN